MDSSQHLVKVPYSVGTQESVEGLESDKKPLDAAQCSVCSEDSNKVKYLIQGQNAILKNATCLVLTQGPDSVAKRMPRLKRVKPKGQRQTASSINLYPVYGLVPLSLAVKRQKNRRKILHGESKFSLKFSSQKLKKTPISWVFQVTVCPVCASKCSSLGSKYSMKKKELHQGKGLSDKALHLIYISKLVFPYIKKYSRRQLMKVLPGLSVCRHSLPKQNKLLDAEQVSYVGSIEKRGNSGNTENVKQHGRDHKGLENISPKISPQLQQSFMVNTYQLKSPCSLLIEINWKNKESLKDPTAQAKETGSAEFCAPNCKKAPGLHIPKHETPLEESTSEPLEKFVLSPKMELNRMKTQEELKSTENDHLPLSNGGKLPTNTSEMQRCFPKGNIQKQKDFLEVVLEFSDVNSLISLGTKKHKSSEQLAGVKTQESTGDIILDKKPLIITVTEHDNLSESEKPECYIRINIKNMQDKRISGACHNATDNTISEPPGTELHRGLKVKTDTLKIMGLCHSAVKQEKLTNGKKIWDAKYIEKRCVFKKPEEHDREEEEQSLHEVPWLTQDFRAGLQLTEKPKYVKVEIGQSSSGSRKIQSKDKEVQPQILSTQMISGTGPCPTMDSFQVGKVKQSTDGPTGRETANPKIPLTVPENLPAGEVFTETPKGSVPFGESPRKILGDHIATEKEDLQRVLPAVVLRSFIMHMLPLIYFERQKVIKRLPGAKSTLKPRCVNVKVKKPAVLLMPYVNRHGTPSPRERLRGNFKIQTKQMPSDRIVADVLPNVIYSHISILPHLRTHSRLNTENHSHSKLKQEKLQGVREEKCLDSINKESDSGNTLQEAKLQDEVRGDKETPPKAVLHENWNFRLDACSEKELKTETEMDQPTTSAETIIQPVYSFIMDPSHVENMKKSLTTQTDLKCTADSEMPSPTTEKSLNEDPLNQTRESDALDYGSATREMGYCFVETKAELPKDLPAIFPETLNCPMPILTHSKLKKKRVGFSPIDCTVKSKSVHMKAMKPSISELSSITGHQEKLEPNLKNDFEKINQANGMAYEFLNTLYSPMHRILQAKGESCFRTRVREGRPQYVDFFDKSNAFYNREEQVQGGEGVEQNTLLEAASQHTQYFWADACQGKETHLNEPDSYLTQELQYQTCFTQTALQIGPQMGPREAEGLQKNSQTENDIAPVDLKSLSSETGNSSLDKCLNTTIKCGLPSSRNPEKQLDSYLMEKNSELPKDLQVTSLKSSDSVEFFVSKSKRKKNTSKIARKKITVSCRYKIMRGKKSSISHMLIGRQTKELWYSLKTKMKNPQQKKKVADAFWEIVHSKLPMMPNLKMNSKTDMQRITRLGHMQLIQEQLPNGRKVCCRDSSDVNNLSSSVKDKKEWEVEHKSLPASENSQGFIFNTHQKENHELVKTDEELQQPGSINVRVQPQIHFTQTILDSASCAIFDQVQLGKPERYTRVSPPKSGEAKIDEIFDENDQKKQTGSIGKAVTFDSCMSAFSITKRKRNFKQYLDMKMLVNPKCGILKAKKPSISYILNLKGGGSPTHRKEIGCNLTTKMKEVNQSKKVAHKMYSFTTITPDINRYSKIERENDMSGEKRLCYKQVKQVISLHEGNSTSDDTKETNRRQFKCNLKVMMEERIPVADKILNVISSDMPISLDMSVNSTTTVETVTPWKMRFRRELQQQEQSPDGERAWCANYSDKRGSASNSVKKVQVQGEVASQNIQFFSFKAHKMKAFQFVNPDLELKKSARKEIPESLSTAQKLQQRTLFTQHIVRSISRSILHLFALKKLPKRTKTQKGLKDTRSPRILSLMSGKSFSESFTVTAQSGISFEKSPRKKLVSSIPEGEIRLQKDLPARTLEVFYFSMPVLSDFKGQRNAAEIPKSRKGNAQMIAKTINITRSGPLSNEKQQDCILENMTKEISLVVSNVFINTSLSSISVSPAIKMHKKVKAKKASLSKKSNITRCWEQGEGKQDEGGRLCTYSYNKCSTSNNTLESRWQNEKNKDSGILFKAGLPFLNTMRRKDQNMLIAEQEAQEQTLVSENISRSIGSAQMIPFQTEKLKNTSPSQKGIVHRIGEKMSCSKSGKEMFDDLFNENESNTTSDGNCTKKLDVHSAVSLQSKEEKEDIKGQEEIKYSVDQNISPIKSGDSVLGEPHDESSRRNMGGHIAKKREEMQRDLLTMSTMSVLAESMRQKKEFKFQERRNLTDAISVTVKAKKTLCSQMLTITDHGNYCRKKQECNLKSTIKDRQQNKSIANTFSPPILFSMNNKIDIEMYSTPKAEMDQQRIKLHNSTYLKLEELPCYREVQKANFTDTQNRSSYTMKMNVPQNKEEADVETINPVFPKHQEKMQGSKDEPRVLLTQPSTSLLSFSPLKLDKEMQRISNAEEIVHPEQIGGDIMKNVPNKKQHMPQKEEKATGKTVAVRVMMHTADISLESEKSPPAHTFHRTELHMNIGPQGEHHEGQGEPPGAVLRKVYVSKPPTNLKLDKHTQVGEEELGIKRVPLFSQMISALSDAEEMEDTEIIGGDVRKRKQDLSQKRKDREHTRTKVDKDLLEITGFSPSQLQLPESLGAGNIKHADSNEGISSCNTIIKVDQHVPCKDAKDRVKIEDGKGKILPQMITLDVETSPLTHLLSGKRLSLNIKEQVTDVQEDQGKPEMVLRKTSASLLSSHLKRDTRMNEKEDRLGTTQSCFPPLKIQDSFHSGKKAYNKLFEGSLLEEEARLKIGIEDKMLPVCMDLKAKKLPLPHILNTKKLQYKITQQKREVEEDKNKLVMNIKNICTSLLTLPYLKFNTTKGEEHITITNMPLPQLQLKESSDAAEIAHAETIDGEISSDVKELKEHMLQKEKKDGEENMDMKSIRGPNDTYLNAKKLHIVLTSAGHKLKEKPPVLLIHNLSDLQVTTKEQEGKVEKTICDPPGVMPTKTWTSSSSPLHINMNVRIKEKSVQALTRFSVSPVNFQESSDSEEVVYVGPIIPDMLINPQEEKQHMPQNKEEVGEETINFMLPTHQEKKMQGTKYEREVKMQETKGYDFNKPKKIALWNEDDLGISVRCLSVSVMSLSQTEETVESETNLEREKRLSLSKFQEGSLNASEIVKRNNSSTVEKWDQNFTNVVPEDSQPFTIDQQQMQKLPSVKSEENLSSEINRKTLTPQTEERVVPGRDISRITKEPNLLIIMQEEKATKPIMTPTQCPYMSEDPEENVETHMKSTRNMNVSPPGVEEPQHEPQLTNTTACAVPPEHKGHSELVQDKTTQKVQQQKPLSRTIPVAPQVKSNEIKIGTDNTSTEGLLPLYEAIKNVSEPHIKNMTQDKVYADIQGKVKAHYPDDWKSPPSAGGPDITLTTIHSKLPPTPILESKALEIKPNQIPKMAKRSFRKFNFYSKQTVSEVNNWRLYPRHKKMYFLSLEGIDIIKLNLKHKYQKGSPHITCMKTLTGNVSSGSKEAITKLSINLESGPSSVTSANKMSLSQILQNYSVEGKDKLLMHFSMKTLEIQMKAFPRIVGESYEMVSTPDRRKPLSKCIHSSVKVPKGKKRILLLFEEKSIHQIELDLQNKYLCSLLGLPVESMPPKPNILPKHICKLNTLAMCKKDNSGEGGSLSIDTELLEQHITFKKQSPHENSMIRRFLEPSPVCVSEPECATAHKDTTVLSVLKSHVTPEKGKHVWFQETATHESFDIKTQENAPGLVDCHSVQISPDFSECQTDVIESPANLEECSALEVHANEESMFLEANPYLSQESENFLFKLQKGISLENLYKIKQIKTDLKPFYNDNLGSHHIGGGKKPSSIVTPSYESHKSRKHRSSSKMQTPDWLYHSSLNTVEVPLVSKYRTSDSLAPLTESDIKLHLAKSQDKHHRYPEIKGRRKAKLDLFRKNFPWDGDHSYTQSKQKYSRKKKVCDYESERADYFPRKHKLASKPHQVDINFFHSERKQKQPFFYACVPADSSEIIPKTVCWTIPQKTLKKRNFRVPLVVKISSSFNTQNLSKKLLGLL